MYMKYSKTKSFKIISQEKVKYDLINLTETEKVTDCLGIICNDNLLGYHKKILISKFLPSVLPIKKFNLKEKLLTLFKEFDIHFIQTLIKNKNYPIITYIY